MIIGVRSQLRTDALHKRVDDDEVRGVGLGCDKKGGRLTYSGAPLPAA